MVNPKTIYTQTLKPDSAGSIYIFEHTYAYVTCNNNNLKRDY